jgi:CRP-like cAMP-binding protein
MKTRHDAQAHNQLLAALPASELSLLRPQLKAVSLAPGSVLQDPGERVQYVYFPVSGMISLLAVMTDGKAVEAATIGREGALGVHCGFGIFHAQTRAVVEIPGAGLRMPAVPFQKCVRESERLRDLLIRYREFRLAETQQPVACNALHAAEGRLARWLLHTSDIIGSDIVPLTQEFLSQVLGVRRTTVTTLARNLLRTGVIRYSRGRIEIRDRDQLKNFTCECYEVLHRLPAQMLPRPKR